MVTKIFRLLYFCGVGTQPGSLSSSSAVERHRCWKDGVPKAYEQHWLGRRVLAIVCFKRKNDQAFYRQRSLSRFAFDHSGVKEEDAGFIG